MAILTATSLAQSFGAVDIFSGVSAAVPNDGKIALVGPNGVGKTTLLLILAGLSKPSHGTVHRARGARLGYLPQESAQAFNDQQGSVYEEMLAVFAGLRQQESRLRQMEMEMEAGRDSEELFTAYSNLLEQFELAGGYEYETRIKQVLDGLGFSRPDWQMPLSHLSGGQKTRALLARLLLEKPDLLILDEPTNHLDVAAIEWLEGMLRIWPGAVLLVSHDRYFLDRVVNHVWEMSRLGIESYRGNYTAYVQQRQERWALRETEFETEKARLEKELDYIRRNIAGQRTQMAKGKLSRISRELEAIHQLGFDAVRGKSWSEVSQSLGGASRRPMSVAEAAEAIKTLPRPSGRPPTFNVRLQSGPRSGNIVLRAKNLQVGYPGAPLFAADDFELLRQECAALIGPNGSGKTTFLRTIMGEIAPLRGQVELGASLKIGYFAQAHEQLDPENQVIDELMRHHGMFTSEARNYLAQYQFRDDDVFKKVGSLSGGERGRLALAVLALEGANFLLLDEPTNHLDIPAQEMLQEVLEQFAGTILLVTHDRYLVDRLATQIWHLEEGRLHVFPGPYQEFLAQRLAAASAGSNGSSSQPPAPPPAASSPPVQRSKNSLKRQADEIDRLEREIARLETKQAAVARRLQEATEEGTFDKIQTLSIEYTSIENKLTELIAEWEKQSREYNLAQ